VTKLPVFVDFTEAGYFSLGGQSRLQVFGQLVDLNELRSTHQGLFLRTSISRTAHMFFTDLECSEKIEPSSEEEGGRAEGGEEGNENSEKQVRLNQRKTARV